MGKAGGSFQLSHLIIFQFLRHNPIAHQFWEHWDQSQQMRSLPMHQFPIILIPPAIQQARSAQPPALTFTEPLPQQPEPEKANATIIAVEATAVIVLSAAIASQGGTVPGLLLFLVAAGAIACLASAAVASPLTPNALTFS